MRKKEKRVSTNRGKERKAEGQDLHLSCNVPLKDTHTSYIQHVLLKWCRICHANFRHVEWCMLNHMLVMEFAISVKGQEVGWEGGREGGRGREGEGGRGREGGREGREGGREGERGRGREGGRTCPLQGISYKH